MADLLLRLVMVLRGVFLLFCVLFSGQARSESVWIALSGNETAYNEVAEALRAALPVDDVRIGNWSEFNFKLSAPRILVTIGGEALRKLHQSAGKTRIVAALTPRSTLDEYCDTSPGRLTGVYFEQPFYRLAMLLRAAFPERTRVGLVLGPTSARYRNEIALSLRRVGMEAVFETIQDQAGLPDAVQSVLPNADVFLALPDAEAINNQTAKFILLASYRRGIPVVGYSSSFVRAGAALAMVTSPTQIGRETAKLVAESLSGKTLPEPRAPEEFEILVNASVSRSLGLGLNASMLTRKLNGSGGER